jgi:hypothetical protein
VKYIVFDDATGVEIKRGICQDMPEALELQAAPGQTAYEFSIDDEAKGTSLIRRPDGVLIAAPAS